MRGPSVRGRGRTGTGPASHRPAFCPSWGKSSREEHRHVAHSRPSAHLSGGSSPFLLGAEPVTPLGAGHSFGRGSEETGTREMGEEMNEAIRLKATGTRGQHVGASPQVPPKGQEAGELNQRLWLLSGERCPRRCHTHPLTSKLSLTSLGGPPPLPHIGGALDLGPGHGAPGDLARKRRRKAAAAWGRRTQA